MSHVVNDNLHRQSPKTRCKVNEIAAIEKQLKVPAERRDNARQLLECVERQSASEKHVDAHPAEAGSVQMFQFLLAHAGIYDGHTRHPPPKATTESRVQRLSVPYTLGWTITACAIPNAVSIRRYAARLASCGVKLRLSVKGYCSTGPKMCAMGVPSLRRRRNRLVQPG